jgi:4-hydroxybenzoate polyprenyltransferase
MRPSHAWKSVPVLAPVLFGHRAGDVAALLRAALAAAATTLAASAGYLVNDVVDARSDRLDPRRRDRPVAARALSARAALALAALLAALAIGLSAAMLPLAATAGVAGYLALSLAYTFALKRVPLVAPVAVAGGFVLRVLVGSSAVSVEPSPWLVGLTAVLALALAVAKREADARAQAGRAPRPLVVATDALLAASIVGYAAYTVAPSTVELHGTHALAGTAPFVAAALLRFRFLLRRDPPRGPAEIVAGDPVILALAAGWAVACAAIVGLRRS